jgi:protoporphyrinogen oxidase
MIYDVIIIGGGISGLNSAYKLIKKNPTLKILIIEKNKLGGRINTYHDKYYQVEEGAARFHEKQKNILTLIRELGLEEHIIKISNATTYIPVTKTRETQKTEQKQEQFIDPTSIINKIIEASKLENKSVLKTITFIEYSKKIVGKENAQLILDSFGYSSELTIMNTYDAINLIQNNLNPKNQFYVLRRGLSQMIDKLHEIIKKLGVQVLIHRKVNDIQYKKYTTTKSTINTITPTFEISCDKIIQKYYAKKCICAVTKETLLQLPIFNAISSILHKIHSSPLCRIYSKFSKDPKTNKVWFQGMQKFTTNNNLRYVIPVDEENGVIMISYTDSKYADFWKKIQDTKGIEEVNRELQRLIKQTLKIDIPIPEHTKIFYWKHGVAYYGTEFDSEIMLKKIMKPYKDIPLFVCGENFSEKQSQWIEGSLETSEKVVKEVL